MVLLSPFTPKSQQKREFLKPHSFKTLSWPLLGARWNSRAGSREMVPTRHTHSASDSYSSILFGPHFVLLLVHLRTTVKVHVEQRLLGHNRKRKQPCITSTCDPSQSPILLLQRFIICIKKAFISRVFKKKKQNAIAVTEI